MRITLTVDSATPEEVYDLTLAFQRTSGIPLPRQINTVPTVTVAGSAMGWTSPAMLPQQVAPLMAEFAELAEYRLLRATSSTEAGAR